MFKQELFKLKDLPYKEFHKKLVPSVDENTIIGIRVPILRAFAKEMLQKDAQKCKNFLNQTPHTYFEENNLHAFFIEAQKDFTLCMELTENFLPLIDNWATCDIFSPKIFKKHPSEVYQKIKLWMKSKQTYTVRFGVGLLLANYLDEHFSKEHFNLVLSIKSNEYYVKMMMAWYFATALAKQYNTTLEVIEQNKLPAWTHNKTIQKATESNRISAKQKMYLRTLKNRV